MSSARIAPIPSENDVAIAVIQRLAKIAEDVAWQAGVGGMETAGSFVSYLAVHPEAVTGFLAGEVGCVDWPSRWHTQGCLSWHGMSGKIYRPEDVASEAGTATTPQSGVVHEHATAESGDAQTPIPSSRERK